MKILMEGCVILLESSESVINRQLGDKAEMAENSNYPKTNLPILSSKLKQSKIVHFINKIYICTFIALEYLSIAKMSRIINYLHVLTGRRVPISMIGANRRSLKVSQKIEKKRRNRQFWAFH
jgi:hypothetical protein